MLKNKLNNCTPNPADVVVPRFVRSITKEHKQKIFDGKGNVVSERLVKVPSVEEISNEEFENVGLTCDMFDFDTQKAAGRDPFQATPITTPLFGMSLDARSVAIEQLDNFNYDELTEHDFEENKD